MWSFHVAIAEHFCGFLIANIALPTYPLFEVRVLVKQQSHLEWPNPFRTQLAINQPVSKQRWLKGNALQLTNEIAGFNRAVLSVFYILDLSEAIYIVEIALGNYPGKLPGEITS